MNTFRFIVGIFCLITTDVVGGQDAFGMHCTANSCGFRGTCQRKPAGSRCQCQRGWMGARCHRPCQDIFKSCERWLEEGRCRWSSVFRTPFFDDHCSASCQTCIVDENNQLKTPMHWMLESLVWLIGRWESSVSHGRRFPVHMRDAYDEVLDIAVTDVPMFDRPPLNFSATATNQRDPSDVHRDVGFLVSLPFNWDNGFKSDKPNDGFNKLSIELNSNTGINTIETGTFHSTAFTVNNTFIRTFPGLEHLAPKQTIRSFMLLPDGRLQERVTLVSQNGGSEQFEKIYRKTASYV